MSKLISSRDNPRYKALKKLAESSTMRRRAGQTLLDGVHLCQVWLETCGEPLSCIMSRSASENAEVISILTNIGGAEVLLLEDNLFMAISQVEHGIGIVFLVATPRPLVPTRLEQDSLLLDRVQDPGNLGSILRSAAAAGIRQIFCSRETVFAWSPRVLRAGMGAHFFLEIAEDCELAALLAGSAIPVFAASSHAHMALYDHNLKLPCAWLFGNEGQGVSDELMQHAQPLAIPQPGGMESLNVAAAAAVCLFEQVRQRRNQ